VEPFKYTYLPSEEVMKNVLYIKDFWVIEIIILVILLYLVFIAINYIFPFLYLKKQEKSFTKEKDKKREFIKKIALQREIEDEIEKEIDYLLKK
jgi:hypothetical protein